MRDKAISRALLVAAFVLPAAGATRAAEIQLPAPAPAASVSQQVGLTEIALEYESAATRGRKIWGAVVPYDRPWMLGSTTRIRFSKDVTIGDKLVPAGTYALLATPGKASWTFMLNKSTGPVASASDYKPELDVARVKVPVKAAPHRERVTFLFSELTDEKTSVDFEWDDVRVSLPVQVDTRRQIEAAIGGLDDSWRSFANAARYMLETKKDYDAGLKYIDQSLALQGLEHVQDWYSLWIKGALFAAKGDFGQATTFAQSAYDLARRSGPFLLEADLVRAIGDWKKRTKPFEKEGGKPIVRATEPPPLNDAAAAPMAASTTAPVAKEKADNADAPHVAEKPADASTSRSAPPGDPPLRRARLRHR